MTTPNLSTAVDRECLALNGRDEMTIQFVEVAGTKALVIDNIYKDPDYVRALALSLDYHRRAGAYPGTSRSSRSPPARSWISSTR